MLGMNKFSDIDARLRSTDDVLGTVMPLIEDGIVKLSPLQAKKILSKTKYPGQIRHETPDGRGHIDVLANLMRRGKWTAKDKLDFAFLDGSFILTNGHHRLSAQYLSGVSIEWLFAVHDCADMSDVMRLYNSFDTNGRPRSSRTILNANQISEELSIKKNTSNNFYKSIPLISANFKFSRADLDHITDHIVDDRLEVMRAYAEQARLWEAATQKADKVLKSRLSTVGALAVALTALKYKPEIAFDFYKSVSENNGLARDTPAHTYVHTLLVNSIKQGGYEATARIAASCWNAFYEKRQLSVPRISFDRGFHIAGTPVRYGYSD